MHGCVFFFLFCFRILPVKAGNRLYLLSSKLCLNLDTGTNTNPKTLFVFCWNQILKGVFERWSRCIGRAAQLVFASQEKSKMTFLKDTFIMLKDSQVRGLLYLCIFFQLGRTASLCLNAAFLSTSATGTSEFFNRGRTQEVKRKKRLWMLLNISNSSLFVHRRRSLRTGVAGNWQGCSTHLSTPAIYTRFTFDLGPVWIEAWPSENTENMI